MSGRVEKACGYFLLQKESQWSCTHIVRLREFCLRFAPLIGNQKKVSLVNCISLAIKVRRNHLAFYHSKGKKKATWFDAAGLFFPEKARSDMG